MSNPSDDLPELAAEDEILQVMYWLRGEGLAAEVRAVDLMRFSVAPEALIRRTLERLCMHGHLRRVADEGESEPRFCLTDAGSREAARRFADEFADMTKPGHGECGDPDCDCHTTGRPEDCSHRR